MKEKMKVALTGVGMWLVVLLLFMPALLVVTEGEDGGPTVWNAVGLVYVAGWVVLAYWKGGRMEQEERE